jgi:hypothetical protein
MFRFFKRNSYMRLSGKIIDLVGQHLAYYVNETGRISQVAMMKNKFTVTNMGILIQVVDSIGIEKRCPSLYSMYFIAFIEEKLRQISSILTCDSSY